MRGEVGARAETWEGGNSGRRMETPSSEGFHMLALEIHYFLAECPPFISFIAGLGAIPKCMQHEARDC